MRKKPQRDKLEKEKTKLFEVIVLFLAKLMGETLKDKLIRATAVGVISAASNISEPPDVESQIKTPQEVSQSLK